MGLPLEQDSIPSLADVLDQENITGGTGIDISSNDHITFLNPSSSSQLRFVGSRGTHSIGVQQTNGDLFIIDLASQNGQPHFILQSTGTQAALASFRVRDITWGRSGSGDIVHTFDSTNEGTMTWLGTADRFQFNQTLQIDPFTENNNFVIHNSSGVLSSFNLFTASNNWSGVNTYNNIMNFGSIGKISIQSVSADPLVFNDWLFEFQGSFAGNARNTLVFSNPSLLDMEACNINTKKLRIGRGTSGQDYTLVFHGDTEDGTFTFLEASGLLTYDKALTVTGNFKADNDATFTTTTAGAETFFYDASDHSILYTLDASGRTGFTILKVEDTPPVTIPVYLSVDVTRTWSGSGPSINNLFNFSLKDVGMDESGASPIVRIMNMVYSRDTGTNAAVGGNLEMIRMQLDYTGTHTNQTVPFLTYLSIAGNTAGSSTSANDIIATWRGIFCDAKMLRSNAGAGSITNSINFIDFDMEYFTNDNNVDIRGYILQPRLLQLAGTDDVLGFSFEVDQALANGGGGTLIGFEYIPFGAGLSSYTLIAFKSIIGDWFNQADIGTGTGHHYFGAGDDSFVGFDGTDFIIEPGSGKVLIGATGDKTLECSGLIFSDYISITLDSPSNGSQTEQNIFDEDEHSAFASTANLTARGITFDSTDGTFNFAKAGKYPIDIIYVLETGTAQLVKIIIKVNGTPVYSEDFLVHSVTDPRGITIPILLDLAANDDLEFFIDAQTANNVNSAPGTTVRIFQIAT